MLEEAVGVRFDKYEIWKIIPRNAVVLIEVINKLGKKAKGEIEIVPLKKGVRYVVTTDGDHAFEEIREDHLM